MTENNDSSPAPRHRDVEGTVERIQGTTHWNYRVVKETITADGETEELFSIRSVYYSGKPDTLENIELWSADGRGPFGTSLENLKADLNMMLAALHQPVLNMEDLPQ